MQHICKHFFVTGRVQGVFYRDTTRKKAIELGITGWVKNLDDGRVELLACGDMEKINALETWLWQGPAQAHVVEVQQRDHPFEDHIGFVVY